MQKNRRTEPSGIRGLSCCFTCTVVLGPRDVLMDAVTKEARSQGLRTAAVSIDRKMNDGVDLDDWEELDKQAEEGEFDYARGGFPCGSFLRMRWSGLPGPPPVRSAEESYGLSSNSKEMQEEADRGTRGATNTSKLIKGHCITCRRRGVPELGTYENPPGDEWSGRWPVSRWSSTHVHTKLVRNDGIRRQCGEARWKEASRTYHGSAAVRAGWCTRG